MDAWAFNLPNPGKQITLVSQRQGSALRAPVVSQMIGDTLVPSEDQREVLFSSSVTKYTQCWWRISAAGGRSVNAIESAGGIDEQVIRHHNARSGNVQ